MLSKDESSRDYTGVILYWFLATDSVSRYESTEFEKPFLRAYNADGNVTIEEQFLYYEKIHYSIAGLLTDFIIQTNLLKYFDLFEDKYSYMFIDSKGANKLKAEFPDIWEEFFPHQSILGTSDKT